VRVARGDVASGTLTVRKLVAHADGGDDSQAGDDGADDPAENSGDDA
jgi:hypothetical protein